MIELPPRDPPIDLEINVKVVKKVTKKRIRKNPNEKRATRGRAQTATEKYRKDVQSRIDELDREILKKGGTKDRKGSKKLSE